MSKGEDAETGYALKKGKNNKIPKNEKKNNSHYCLSYSSYAATSPGREIIKNILAKTSFLTSLRKFMSSKNLFYFSST